MTNKLNVGVVGLRMGQEHIDGYLSHPNAHLQAICDLNPDVVNSVGDKYQVDARYTDYAEMFEQEALDVVSIVTPNSFHKPMTEQALERGMHVLCEKPVGLNCEEAIAMNRKAEEMGKRLMVNYSYRYKPSSVAMKKQIEAGMLGEIQSSSCLWLRNKNGFSQITPWFSKKSMAGGGSLIDIGIHCLDKMLWLLDFPEPKSVLATTHDQLCKIVAASSGLVSDVEDTVEALITFTNNASLTMHISWAANIPESNLIEFKLYGSQAGIFEQNIAQGYTFAAKTFYERDGISYDLRLEDVDQSLVTSSMYHFIDAIVNDKPHMGNGTEAIKAMNIIDAIYQSAETGDPVTF